MLQGTTAKFKFHQYFLHSVWGQTAKFNDHQYFWLYTVADPEGPSFEGLPSKILCANVLRTLHSHWSYAFSFNSSNNACVSTHVIRRAWLRAHIYYQEHVATSELKLIRTLLPLQLAMAMMAICYQYESTYIPAPYADNQLLCSLCSQKTRL